MLDHTGSQAVLLYSTPSTPWLQLPCPVSCVHMCVCMCVCSCLYVSPAWGLFDRSCPNLYAGLRGKADLSLLQPLQRGQGWAEGARAARLASTAAASLGFGSWGTGAGVKVEEVEGWGGVGVLQKLKVVTKKGQWRGGRRAETGGMGIGAGMLLKSEAGSLASCLCLLFNMDRPSALWCHFGVCAHVCDSPGSSSSHPQGVMGPAW